MFYTCLIYRLYVACGTRDSYHDSGLKINELEQGEYDLSLYHFFALSIWSSLLIFIIVQSFSKFCESMKDKFKLFQPWKDNFF